MADNCARCGRKVKGEENWLRADHLWASNAVFHWNCFISLLKAEGAASAEGATWKADGQEPANR